MRRAVKKHALLALGKVADLDDEGRYDFAGHKRDSFLFEPRYCRKQRMPLLCPG